jgi:hypothetical protein
VVSNEPGLYFVGRLFLYAFSSTMIHGVARDAERIVKTLAARLEARSHSDRGPRPRQSGREREEKTLPLARGANA